MCAVQYTCAYIVADLHGCGPEHLTCNVRNTRPNIGRRTVTVEFFFPEFLCRDQVSFEGLLLHL